MFSLFKKVTMTHDSMYWPGLREAAE